MSLLNSVDGVGSVSAWVAWVAWVRGFVNSVGRNFGVGDVGHKILAWMKKKYELKFWRGSQVF